MSRQQSVIFGGKSCLEPTSLYREFLDRSLPVDAWFGKANSIRIPLGEEPGRGWLLMTKADIDSLVDTTTASPGSDSDLELIDGTNSVTLKRIVFVGSECLAPSDEEHEGTPYLVSIADRRVHLAKVPINKAFNLRTNDGTDYHATTKNSGTAWTWSEMVQHIWELFGGSSDPAGLGAYPGLPFTPHGTPENFDYYDTTAWHALNHVLTRIACAVKYDPIADTFSIVRLGDNTTTAANALAEMKTEAGMPLWDAYPVDSVRFGRPEKVRVLFVHFPAPTDGSSWYAVENVTLAAADGVVTGTYVTLFDDLAALSGNAATRTARASERATDWLRRWQYFERSLAKVFDGFHGTKAVSVLGETVRSVAWGERGSGARTEFEAGPDESLLLWQPVRRTGGGGSDCDYTEMEPLLTAVCDGNDIVTTKLVGFEFCMREVA